jgi:hypothetical protein
MTPQPNKNAQQPENRYGIDTLLLIISFLSSLVKNVIISFNLFSLAGLLPKLIELAGKWKEVVNEATDLTKEEWARLGGAFVQELLPFFSAESLSKLIAGTRDLDARDRHWLAGFAHVVPVSRGLADPFNPESYSEDELAQIGQGFMAQLTALTQGSEEIEELNEVQKFLYDLVGDAEAKDFATVVCIFSVYNDENRQTPQDLKIRSLVLDTYQEVGMVEAAKQRIMHAEKEKF